MRSNFKKNSKRHIEFKNKISDETYKSLEKLYNIVIGQERSLDNSKLSKEYIDVKQSLEDNKMKKSIYYIRQCSMIESLLVEYEKYDGEIVKNIIDYYINSNCMQEMNNIGLGWYYDVKYKKDTATLYSVGYGGNSNWIEWLQKKNTKENNIKENGIQLVFEACNEHINRGGNIRLKSLSKCFGVDLFKYMQLDNNGSANLYIIKDSLVNFIKNNEKEMSLQEYLLSNDRFDVNNKPQFCIDFSHPRNEKAKNYNNWSTRFLQNKKYISQAEFNEEKRNYGIESDELNVFIYKLIEQEHAERGETAISSRISPIADKEVIASDTLWSIKKYTQDLKKEDIILEECIHFTFDSTEYCQLIVNYFKRYTEKKDKSGFPTNYNSKIVFEKNKISNEISKLEKEQKEFKNLSTEKSENKTREMINKKYEENKNIIKFYSSYEEFLNNTYEEKYSENVNGKIELALSFIDWSKEEVPKNWSIDNIYTVKENKLENFKINLYKCICKDAAVGGD